MTRGSRNIALAIHTDDVVIWFTEGEDPRVTSAARRGNLALAMNTDDVVIWFTVGEDPRSPEPRAPYPLGILVL